MMQFNLHILCNQYSGVKDARTKKKSFFVMKCRFSVWENVISEDESFYNLVENH